jgi:hypothetical protein
MRAPMLSIVVLTAALFGEIQGASAQSAYSYPWCSRQNMREGSTTSCYFTSQEQCMTTLSGIGGWCYRSPFYHPSPASPTVHPPRRSRAH